MTLFAETSFSTEQILMVTFTVVVSLAGTVTVLFKLLVASKDQRLADSEARRIADEVAKEKALKDLEIAKDKEAAAQLAEKEKAYKELELVKKQYAEIAAESYKSAVDQANFSRQLQNKPPIIMAPAVISDSHSDSTAAQREIAAISTLRAGLAKVKAETGQEPRAEPPHAAEPEAVHGDQSKALQSAETTIAVAKDTAKILREM